MLGLFVNRLTTVENNCRLDIENLQEEFQTALAEKQKKLSEYFIAFR